MRTKKLLTLLIALCVIACSLFAVTAFAETQTVVKGSKFANVSNERATITAGANGQTTLDLEVKDAQPTNTRVYYTENVNIKNVFEAQFTLNSLCTDGGFKIAFLSSNQDYPLQNYGSGFGLWFWDETAWGNDDRSSLKIDPYAYSSTAGETRVGESRHKVTDGTFIGTTYYVKAWEYDNDNYVVQVYINDVNGTNVQSNIVPKANVGSSFDPTNCVFFVTPTVDSREHSYVANVNITFNHINNAKTTIEETVGESYTSDFAFGDAFNNGRVTSQVVANNAVQLTLATTDAAPSNTRAYATTNVDIRNAVEFNVKLDNMNVYGGFKIALLSSKDGYPLQNYGDGFGLWFWDETAWLINEGAGLTFDTVVKTALRVDTYVYNSTNGETNVGADAYRLETGKGLVYDGINLYVKFWDFDADNYAVTVCLNNANGSAILTRGIPKASLSKNFDATNCVLFVTPTVDSREQSYASDVKITVSDVKGFVSYSNVTATAGENGQASATATGSVQNNNQVTFTATPDENYVVDTATVNGEAVTLDNNTYTVTVKGDVAFNVTFKEMEKFNVTATAGENGQVSATATGEVYVGKQVTFTVAADEGYMVDTATVNGEAVTLDNNTYTVTVNGDVAFNVTFKELPKTHFSVTATAGEGGHVSVTENVVEKGESVTFTVTANEGYMVDTATVNGEAVALDNNTYALTVEADVVFNVTFKLIPITYYNVTATSTEGGSVEATQTGEVKENDEVIFTVTVNTAYKVVKATVNGEEVVLDNNTYTVTVTDDVAFAVELAKYSIAEENKFSDALANNRVDAVITDNGNEMTFAINDGTKSLSRAVYEDKISLSSFEMTFIIDQLCKDGGFRISFVANADQYPMETYGDALSIWFWDETAWGKAELSSLRADVYAYTTGSSNNKTMIEETRIISEGSVIGAKVYVKVWDFDTDNLAVSICVNDVEVASRTILKSLLPENLDYNNCYLLVTPELDDFRAHSWEKDVKLTVASINVTAGFVTPDTGDGNDPVNPEDPEVEYSIVYYVGDKIVRVAYANEGDTFVEYTPDAVEGMTFKGWYTDKEFTTPYEYGAVTADVTVYAKYEASVPVDGCFAGVGTSSLFALALAVAGVALLKKKD